MKALFTALATTALAIAPLTAVAGAHVTHPSYAAPHSYHPASMRPSYSPHRASYAMPRAPQRYAAPRDYTMQHGYAPYSNPQVYRHPYNNGQTHNAYDRPYRAYPGGGGGDRRYANHGYYDYAPGYGLALGFYGGGDYGAPDYDEGYAAPYDGGYPPPDDQGYDPGYDQSYDNGYAQQGYDSGDGDQGYSQGYDQYGPPPQPGWNAGPPAQACGGWMWDGRAGRYQWQPCNCPPPGDDGQ